VNHRALEERAAALAEGLLTLAPRWLALALGRGLGRLLGDLDGRHVAVALDNLRRAFPHWDEARLLRTARGVYAHFGQILLDVLWLAPRGREAMVSLLDFEGIEHYKTSKARGRGILFFTAHIGNWEVHAIGHAWVHGPLSVVARPLDNPALDVRLCRFRMSSGNAVIQKRQALGQVLRALRKGEDVAMLIDQNVQEKDGVFIDFFGRPAATTTVAAALALKTGCALIPVHAELGATGRYRLVYEAPVVWPSTGDRQADIKGLTQRLAQIIEGWVRDTPEQWLWLHRRWKTQPKAETSSLEAPAGYLRREPLQGEAS